jgi:hypothetical protein
MSRAGNPHRRASYWLTNLPARLVGAPTEPGDTAGAGPDREPEGAELRFGYTLDDLDRLSRVAVQVSWTMAGDANDRYTTAWEEIVEQLYAADAEPSERSLISAGQAAIRTEVRSVHRTHGMPLDGGAGNTYGVMTYWWLTGAPSQGPERSVVERETLRRVLPLLPGPAREALIAVASCDGDRDRAAAILRVQPRTVWKHLQAARDVFLAAWHEGETPSRVWREPRRRLADDRLVPCGTPSAYHRHRRRGETTCEPCRRALDQARKDRQGRARDLAMPS